jgi:hypothetical protein
MKRISLFAILILMFSVLSSYSQTPLTLKLTGGMSSPMGDFANVYKSGASVEAGIFYSLPFPGLDLTFTAGYNGFKYKNDYFTGLVTSNLGVAVDNFGYSWTATDIPIMVGAKYMLPAGSMKPYVTGEVGLHLMSFSDRFNGQKLTGNLTNPTTFSYNGATESGSEVGVGTTIGVGIEIPLVPKISLDLNAKYYYAGITYAKSFNVFRNNTSQFTTSELKNLNFITVRGGIVISL